MLAITALLAGPVPPVSADTPTIAVDGICVPLRTATITAPVQEIIDVMLVEEGAQVTQGEVLVRLRSRLQEIAVERAARILEKKEFDFNAAESLSADRIVSRERALNAEIDLALARVDYEEAEHLLNERTITAPFDGFIIRRYKEPGESIDRMEPLYALVNIDILTLQLFVEPDLAARLQPGDQIPFTATGDLPPQQPAAADSDPADNPGDLQRLAVVEFISPAADPSSGLVRVSLRYPNDDHQVRAGTRVTAHLPAPPATTAPAAATATR